jgi:hypothetical protein
MPVTGPTHIPAGLDGPAIPLGTPTSDDYANACRYEALVIARYGEVADLVRLPFSRAVTHWIGRCAREDVLKTLVSLYLQELSDMHLLLRSQHP